MHTHEWSQTSAHTTSQGRVVYVRCPCGAHGVELEEHAAPSSARRLATVGDPVRPTNPSGGCPSSSR